MSTLIDAELTYCTNVHPGESLPAVRELLQRHVTRVKAIVSPSRPFGVGLRLANAAAMALEDPVELERFKAELDELGLYCFTLNGFPYGTFHGKRVKEDVYLPDWRSEERVKYTRALGRIASALLPEGVDGSISTVPGCFKTNVKSASDEDLMVRALLDVVVELIELARSQGKTIALALEPEPECFLETTEQAVRFFEDRLFSAESALYLARAARIARADVEGLLRRHLGVCLDTCHASVEFEAPLDAWRRLMAAGISVPKVQLSTGLRLREATREHIQALEAFADDVYLHQTVVKRGESLERYLDLPDVFRAHSALGAEWRVHFHVPIFHAELGVFESTQADLLPLLGELARLPHRPHLEVETYTWEVLPEAFRKVPLEQAIARELRFVEDCLTSTRDGKERSASAAAPNFQADE